MAPGMGTISNHRAVHFHEAPPMFGYPLAGSTVLFEHAHKNMKLLYKLTQRRAATNDRAVGARLLSQAQRGAARNAARTEPASTSPPLPPRRARASQAQWNTLTGRHPAEALALAPRPAAGAGGRAILPPPEPSCLLWPSALFDGRDTTPATQAGLLRRELDRFFHTDKSNPHAYAITFHAGVRLVNDEDGSLTNIGIARALPSWNGAPRYNVCRVVLTSASSGAAVPHEDANTTELGYARLALIMRVTHNQATHDVVLVRWYDAVPRERTEHKVYSLLGPLLQYAPHSAVHAWQILPVAALLDVWKLERDARNPARYFVNQFVRGSDNTAHGPETQDHPLTPVSGV
jgi:hypothetical protein